MKLFDGFEAVKFPEENLIFVAHDSYLYYIFSPNNNSWQKYRNAGYDRITVSNYGEVSKEELVEAMHGVLPAKETDFMRLCRPEQLSIRDLLDLLTEAYSFYLSDCEIHKCIHYLLLESDIAHKSYEKIRKLLDNASELQQDNHTVLTRMKELCFTVTGRDIFKKEIGIDNSLSSTFLIRPVRVIDDSNTDDFDNVAEMSRAAFTIDDTDASIFLAPFLFYHFDNELAANKNRVDYYSEDDEGNEQIIYRSGFEWNLTHNFYTYDSVKSILSDIRDTIDALSSGRETEFTVQIKEKLLDRLEEKGNSTDLIIDFYRRFIYRMEYLMTVGGEKGYDLISFMGP